MSMPTRPRLPRWLLGLVVAIGLADVGLTLQGQPSTYWLGDYGRAVEANPIARLFVCRHPLAFAGMAAVYLLALLIALRTLPHRGACWLALAVVCGHTVGVGAWLLRMGPTGPWLTAGFLIAVSPLFRPMRRLCELSSA